MSTNKTPEQVWDDFLQRWPQQALAGLTLAQYAQGEDEDCFGGWLRYLSDELGWRPGGGTHYPQIGVSALPATSLDTYRGNPKYGVDEPRLLGWLRELGTTADEAFAKTRARLCQIAEAAARGDVSVLSQPVLYDIYEWKLFFIYQNRQQPVLLPLNLLDDIPQWYYGKFGKSLARGKRPKESDLSFALRCNQLLMAVRDGVPVFKYVAQLKQMVEERYLAQEQQMISAERQLPSLPTVRKPTMSAMNQILYGPPGTGKTYETIYAALQILDPAAAKAYQQVDKDVMATLDERLAARAELKARFDELASEQRVRFVTFHQSFSYEDFVEGLRAETVNGQVQYRVASGVFKQICDDASATPESVSLDALLDRFIEQVAETPEMLSTATGKQFLVSYGEGNATLTCEPQASKTAISLPANIEHVRALLAGKVVGKLYCASYVKGIVEHIRQQLPSTAANLASGGAGLPHVLIIDEINRGNISRIFGELITLIEPSKRAGASEALSVTLPYSKARFSVPDNVYLIGTMNTTDRSLAGLDLALRRRFSFREMPPRPDLLDAVAVDGINIGQMLRVMNQRIAVLLDRDHTLGHAYFMPLQTEPTLARLAAIFRQAILPLLQEYFFEDWERIRWVLNDQSKPDSAAFIVEDKSLDVSGLFPGVQDRLRQTTKWKLNPEAFKSPAAYRGIAANLGQIASGQPAAEEASV